MKKFEPYGKFLGRTKGDFEPLPGADAPEGSFKVGVMRLFKSAGFAARDIRRYADGRTWARLEDSAGMQVATLWDACGALVAWSVPLDDCGAVERERAPLATLTLDALGFVRRMEALAKKIRETDLVRTILAFGIGSPPDAPASLPLCVVGRSNADIAEEASRTVMDGRAFAQFAGDDPEDLAEWKRAVLRLAAALGGDAVSQRELAWGLDPENAASPCADQDRDLAARWYLWAAEQGDGLAAHNYAYYRKTTPDLAKHDCAEAVRWLRVAVKAGVPESKRSLENCLTCNRCPASAKGGAGSPDAARTGKGCAA